MSFRIEVWTVSIGERGTDGAQRCIFCSSFGLSKEHFWPGWAHSLFAGPKPPNDAYRLEFITGTEVRFGPSFGRRQGTLLNKKFRVVCKKCNNGWMSQLETDVKPIILAMLSGERVAISAKEQAALARWIMLKVIVIDQSIPRDAVISAHDRMEFMAGRAAEASFTIYVAHCISPRWSLNMFRKSVAIAKAATPVSSSKNVQTTAFGFGTLFCYCVVHTVPEIDLTRIMHTDPRTPSIPSDECLMWPPETSIGEEEANEVAQSMHEFLFGPNIRWVSREGAGE